MNEKINEKTNRTERVRNELADTSEKAFKEWADDFIIENVPKVMNWSVARIKEFFSSLEKGSNKKVSENIRKGMFECIEIGEVNKERAMIMAMKKAGVEDAKIKEILELSNKYLVQKDDVIAR